MTNAQSAPAKLGHHGRLLVHRLIGQCKLEDYSNMNCSRIGKYRSILSFHIYLAWDENFKRTASAKSHQLFINSDTGIRFVQTSAFSRESIEIVSYGSTLVLSTPTLFTCPSIIKPDIFGNLVVHKICWTKTESHMCMSNSMIERQFSAHLSRDIAFWRLDSHVFDSTTAQLAHA